MCWFKECKNREYKKVKKDLSKTTIIDKKRYVIIDEIDTLNINCLNALLKILEEPGEYDYFMLINNKSNPLLETIKSRCLEIKFIINKEEREMKLPFSF